MATCTLLGLCVLSYLTLPLLLNWEAMRRKNKTGSAMPLQAMADAENSQVNDSTMARVIEMSVQGDNVGAEKGDLEDGKADHFEKSDKIESRN